MATKKQIRQTFTTDWCTSHPVDGKNAWLIKGDFDRFKWTNDLYGSLLCDYLLDWTLEVIEAELRAYQQRFGRDEILWNFMGDDVTIYVPPSMLAEDDIAQLLWHIRGAITKSFHRRYMVGTIPLPSDFFDDIPVSRLETMRNELEQMDVIFDFARRQRGYLVLFPVDSQHVGRDSIDSVLQIIRHRSGKYVPSAKLQMCWIYDPDDESCREFNEGFIKPPSISFAACSIRMGVEDTTGSYDRRAVYERVSLVCQSALKACKQQRKRVHLQKYDTAIQDIYAVPQPAGGWAFQSPLRWSSERYLRETLYFKQLDQPTLFQFNPVYSSASSKFRTAISDQILWAEKYRGNQYGVGLKGINEIFGQSRADCLITELMSVFSKVMYDRLVQKGIPPAGVHIARFVDRFTVCCEQPFLQVPQIIELVRGLAGMFNYVSDEIKIAHVRTNIVMGEEYVIGYRLFRQLALTSLSPRSIIIEDSNPPIEVRQNRPLAALHEGHLTLERNSFSSARLLDVYAEGISQK